MTWNKCFFVLSGPIFRGSPSAIKVHVRSKASEHSLKIGRSSALSTNVPLLPFLFEWNIWICFTQHAKTPEVCCTYSQLQQAAIILTWSNFPCTSVLWKLILHNMHIIQTIASVLSNGYTSSVFKLKNSPNKLRNISN